MSICKSLSPIPNTRKIKKSWKIFCKFLGLLNLFRIFAIDMNQKNNIENAVSTYFKVDKASLYTKRKSTYPLDGARYILMYLLYVSGIKSYILTEMFNMSKQMVYRHIAEVQVALRSDTKIREDVEKINELLNNKK